MTPQMSTSLSGTSWLRASAAVPGRGAEGGEGQGQGGQGGRPGRRSQHQPAVRRLQPLPPRTARYARFHTRAPLPLLPSVPTSTHKRIPLVGMTMRTHVVCVALSLGTACESRGLSIRSPERSNPWRNGSHKAPCSCLARRGSPSACVVSPACTLCAAAVGGLGAVGFAASKLDAGFSEFFSDTIVKVLSSGSPEMIV